jgi:hypothetical protein
MFVAGFNPGSSDVSASRVRHAFPASQHSQLANAKDTSARDLSHFGSTTIVD